MSNINLIIRKKIIWAEIKTKEQEYSRLSLQIKELEIAKKDVSFQIQKKLSENEKINIKLNTLEDNTLIVNSL
jgi:hypothetical protein